MKKTISLSFSLLLMVSLFIPAMTSNTEVISFSDVPSNHWAYSAIMSMVQSGIINGTSDPDENGVATYSPDDPMQRAEFLAILTRHLYGDEVNAAPTTNPWYNTIPVAVTILRPARRSAPAGRWAPIGKRRREKSTVPGTEGIRPNL